MPSIQEDREGRRESIKTVPTHLPPDGGWGWAVAAGATMITLLSPMILQSFSILFAKLFRDNETSTTTIAWIFSLSQISWNITTISMPSLCVEFGWRKMSIFGGLLVASSTMLSSLVRKSELLFFTTSLLYGVGASFGISIFPLITSQYFEKKRGRVIGMIGIGFSAGQFVAPLLVRRLQELYGSEGALLIMGAIFLNIVVGASLYQPVEWHLKEVKPPINISIILTDSKENVEAIVPDEPQQDLPPPSQLDVWKRRLSTISQISVFERKESEINEEVPEREFGHLLTPNLDSKGRKLSRIVQIRESARSSTSYDAVTSVPAYFKDYLDEHPVDSTDVVGQRKENLLIEILRKIGTILRMTLADISHLKSFRVLILAFGCSLNIQSFFNYLILVPFSVVSKGHSLESAAYCLTVLGVCDSFTRPIVSSLTDVIRISPKWYFMIGCLIASASSFAFSFLSEREWLLTAMAIYGFGIGNCMAAFTHMIIETMGVKLLPTTIGAYGFASLILSPSVGPVLGFLRDVTQNYDNCLRLISVLHLVPFGLWLLMPLAKKYDAKREMKNSTET